MHTPIHARADPARKKNAMQYVAVCYSVLQCIALRCSELQGIKELGIRSGEHVLTHTWIHAGAHSAKTRVVCCVPSLLNFQKFKNHSALKERKFFLNKGTEIKQEINDVRHVTHDGLVVRDMTASDARHDTFESVMILVHVCIYIYIYICMCAIRLSSRVHVLYIFLFIYLCSINISHKFTNTRLYI